jgi:signal transduction histidine kinase
MRRRALQCLVLTAGLLLPNLVAAQPSQRSVLVLDQSSAFLPFNAAVANAIRATVNADSRWRISFYSEHLDANRFFGPDYENALVQFLKAKYRDRPIDVVTVFGVSALDFMVRRRDEIWPSVPVIFAAIDEATVASLTLPKNVTGVTMQLTLQDMVKVARMVVPYLKAVAMVGDPLERQTFYRHFKDEIPAVAAQYEIVDLMDLPLAELKTRLGSLPDTTAVIYTGIYYTTEGVSYVPAELTSQIAEWANRPVVINVSSYLNKGAVGGYIVQANPIGQQAGRLAVRILGGENASDIPVVKVPSQLIFEWPALQRWKISESALPPGSEIQFRVPSVWDQYRPQILAILAALFLQAALIFWLIYEHRRRHRAEVQARNSIAELTHVNRVATAGELSAAIAHEVKQPLSAMVTMANAGLRWLSREKPEIGKAQDLLNKIAAAGHQASDIVTNIRALFGKETQEKVATDVNKLIRAVFALVYMDLRKHSIEVQVNLSEQVPQLIGNQVQLQQVILNLVMNAIESMASAAEPRVLSLKSEVTEHNSILVSITDTGSGISVTNLGRIFKPMFTTKARGMGMGLSICKSIIESHNGRIWVSANAPRGSVFHFELPVQQGGKSDLSDPTLAVLKGSPASAASARSLANELIE